MPAGRSGAGVTQTRVSKPSSAGRPSAWVSSWLTVKALPPHSLTWLRHRQDVSQPAGVAEGCAGLQQRHAAHIEIARHLRIGQRVGREQPLRRLVEPGVEPGVEDDAGGIAMRPFHPDFIPVLPHRPTPPRSCHRADTYAIPRPRANPGDRYRGAGADGIEIPVSPFLRQAASPFPRFRRAAKPVFPAVHDSGAPAPCSVARPGAVGVSGAVAAYCGQRPGSALQ